MNTITSDAERLAFEDAVTKLGFAADLDFTPTNLPPPARFYMHIRTNQLLRTWQAARSSPGAGLRLVPEGLLAKKHTGMRVDYSGLLGQCQRALAHGHSANAEMLRQLQGHLKELGQRWYAGDTAVVDEILQLYCIEKDAREALAAAPSIPDAEGPVRQGLSEGGGS